MVETSVLAKKISDSKDIIRQAFDRFPHDELRVAWTGGKDSTVVLWLVREVCKERDIAIPRCFCIDEGDMFDEVQGFLDHWRDEWDIQLDMIHNSDVSGLAGALGAEVDVARLNERNRKEVERIGWEEETFTYEPESYVGNHLMKTVTCMTYLEEQKVGAFFEGIRWDEQGARQNEVPFSQRKGTAFNPEHYRVNPVLHFTERDVWDAIHEYDMPVCTLYGQGYRSLGAKVTTKKITDVPAWEQDLENTTERGGRRQDKEGIMKKLRDLGYM
jgi:phosphoadenosine phosphosulfate reductase